MFYSTEVDDFLYSKQFGSSFEPMYMHSGDGMVVSDDTVMIDDAFRSLSSLYDRKWNGSPTERLGIKIHFNQSHQVVIMNQQ